MWFTPERMSRARLLTKASPRQGTVVQSQFLKSNTYASAAINRSYTEANEVHYLKTTYMRANHGLSHLEGAREIRFAWLFVELPPFIIS
jgi:hypothetical protein